jgi:hypothetical protein
LYCKGEFIPQSQNRTLVKNGEATRIEKREWDEVEDFFKRLLMGAE